MRDSEGALQLGPASWQTHTKAAHTTKTIYLQTEFVLLNCSPPVPLIPTPAEDGNHPQPE